MSTQNKEPEALTHTHTHTRMLLHLAKVLGHKVDVCWVGCCLFVKIEKLRFVKISIFERTIYFSTEDLEKHEQHSRAQPSRRPNTKHSAASIATQTILHVCVCVCTNECSGESKA